MFDFLGDDFVMSNSNSCSGNKSSNSSPSHKNCLKCDVCNCIHNDQHCGCTAKQIVVGPDFAKSQSDTVCGTFEKTDY